MIHGEITNSELENLKWVSFTDVRILQNKS